MATIITKNSSTASSVPLNTQLVQGELAVNVTDKRLFTENASGTVVELGTNPSSLTLPNGTANGVAYLNGSKALTTGSALQFDGANLGLGVTPSAWGFGKAFEVADNGSALWGAGVNDIRVMSNAKYDTGYKYVSNGYANMYINGTANGSHTWFTAPSGTAGNAISFTQAMTLDASGRLGLGVTSPAQILEIKTGAGANAYIEIAGNNNTPNSTSMLVGQGSDNSGYCWNRANAALLFGTNNTERARIDSSGNLLVGTTNALAQLTVSNSNATGYGLWVDGKNGSGSYIKNTSANDVIAIWGNYNSASPGAQYIMPMRFGTDSGLKGSIYWNGSSVSYNTSSDYRLKENIQPMTGALAKVAALKPCTYKWKADGSEGEGFIAHELAEVVPQCVTGEKDAVDAEGNPVYQGIDTSFLVATLTAAIQEQQAIIESLKADVAALKAAA